MPAWPRQAADSGLQPRPRDWPLRVLCLGAHSDDIEIDCGGTILTLA
jgi:LmbE family N-acetylglucosaminyl deacetylase